MLCRHCECVCACICTLWWVYTQHFKNSFLGVKLWTMVFTHGTYMIQWFLVNLVVEYFRHAQTFSCACLLSILLPLLDLDWLILCHYGFAFSGHWNKWNCTICRFWVSFFSFRIVSLRFNLTVLCNSSSFMFIASSHTLCG